MNTHLYDMIDIDPAIETTAITTATTTNGADVNKAPAGDVQYHQVLFYIDTGAYTSGDFVFGIEEADDNGAGAPDTYADAAAAVVVGGDAGAATITVTDNSAQNSQLFLGYRGIKQWCRLTIVSSNTPSWADIEAHTVLGDPDTLPVR